jgi:hypothetical protein
MAEAKPYAISKKVVWEAYQKVKANKGAAGVDGQSIEAFEKDLKNNLYTHLSRNEIWQKDFSQPTAIKAALLHAACLVRQVYRLGDKCNNFSMRTSNGGSMERCHCTC